MLVVSVQSVASCLRPRWLNVSESLSFSDRCAGWMWQVEHCVAPGPPIGGVSTPRSSRLSSVLRGFPLHHVPLVRSVRIIAGVGPIGSHGMPGGDHRNCALPLRASLPFLLSSNTGGIGSQQDDFNEVSSPLRAGHEGQESLFASNYLFHSFIARLLSTRCVSRGQSQPQGSGMLLTAFCATVDQRRRSNE